MKIRYDVKRMIGTDSVGFESLKDAFALAKAMAREYDEEIVLAKLVWDDTNHIVGSGPVLVSASGKFRYI